MIYNLTQRGSGNGANDLEHPSKNHRKIAIRNVYLQFDTCIGFASGAIRRTDYTGITETKEILF